MNNYKFIRYLPTPTDEYILGIVTLLFHDQAIIRLKHVKRKDGGTFFTSANYTITGSDQTKSYTACFEIDSKVQKDLLDEFIREKVNESIAKDSLRVNPTASPSVKEDDGLPF